MQPRRHEKYDQLIARCHTVAPVRTIVVHPCDEASLTGAVEAAAAGIITPTLVGPEPRIRALAASLKLDLGKLALVHQPHSHAAAAKGRRAGARGAERRSDEGQPPYR